MKYTFSVIHRGTAEENVCIIADNCTLSNGFFHLENAKMDMKESRIVKQFLINSSKIDLVSVEEEK